MLKFLAIFFAASASTAIGLYKSDELKRRRRLLVEFQDLLLQISTEIGYFKEPLPKIFEKLSGEEKECRLLLRCCLSMYNHSDINLSQIWKNAIREIYANQPLIEEDIILMKKCGDFLGQSDLKGQQEHLQLIQRQLERQIKDAEKMISTKGQMYGKLGLSAGLVIAIMFI